MMTDLELFLTEKGETRVDPSHLKILGKKAAAKYISEGTDLNKSVAELSKEASLNDEQTRRVVEHANTATFLALFNGEYNANIEFPVADYKKVASQAFPQEIQQRSIPYVKAVSYVPGQEYVSLEDAFAVEGEVEKAASENWSSEDKQKYFDTYYKVKQASSDLAILKNSFELKFDRVRSMTYQLSKEGNSGHDIALLFKHAGISSELTEMILAKSGVEIDANPINSNRVANENHELYEEARDLSENLKEILNTRTEIEGLISSADVKRVADLKRIV